MCARVCSYDNRTELQNLRRRTVVGRGLCERTDVERGGFPVVRRARHARLGRFVVLDVRRRVLGRQRPQEHRSRAVG